MKMLICVLFLGVTLYGMEQEPIKESPRSIESGQSVNHHHLSITIDRDSPIHEPEPELTPNRLRYKLAIVSAVTAIITAGITATVTILTKKSCS